MFLDIADVVPKPFPLPEAAGDQIDEIRDAASRFEAHFRALLARKDADLRSPDRDDVLHFDEANKLVPPPKTGSRRVVLLGDSITAQWRFNQYFPDEDFLNRGIGGQLTGQLLTRMKADVIDLKPAVVVIQGGNFDLARDVPLELIASNVQLMADIAAANKIKVVIASVLPGNLQSAAINDWLKAFAAQRKFSYADFYGALADVAEISDDGLIPNSKGYRLMAPVLARALEQSLKPPANK
jgi:lysophospholipase L1-like esterase